MLTGDSPGCKSLAARSLQNAEDIAGEEFLRLVERIDGYAYQGRPILAWLYTMARNLVTDHQRKQVRARSLPLAEELVAHGESPSDWVDRRLTGDCLASSLRHLTEDQRRVILHKFVEGRSNSETASLIGKTEGAVKSLQHRALAALHRAVLKERCYEPEV
jgi:RNA polymerase sigma-70 factor (ECF subfamily)